MSVCLSVSLSVHPLTSNTPAPTGRIFMKFDISLCFKQLSWKYKLHLNMTKVTGTLHEDQHTFTMVSCCICLRTKNVSDRSCRENQNTHFMCAIKFFFLKSWPLWDNVEKIWWSLTGHRWQYSIIRRISLARWITKATNTHREYVIPIAFSRQKSLRERATVLRDTCLASLFFLFSSCTISLDYRYMYLILVCVQYSWNQIFSCKYMLRTFVPVS